MAKIPDRLVGPAQVATGPTTVFTAPAGGVLARWVRVSNPSGGAVTFTLSVGADAAGTRVYDAVSVAAGGVFFDYPYLELDEGEVLQASASSNNVLVLTVGGDELDAAAVLGARVYGPFPFAFDDAGLNNGIAFYTPTVDDILLNGWIEILVPWDGTTPGGDIGTGIDTNKGLINETYAFGSPPPSTNGMDMTLEDGEFNGTGVLTGESRVSLVVGAGLRPAPSRFMAANPLKVWVSQDGQQGGADPGSTQGQANIYLVVATPYLP